MKEEVLRKLKEFLTNLNTLQESVRLIENDREESWEAISHKVSTLVEGSVESLTERLTELEHTVQSRRTTPVTDDDILNEETWSTMEQALLRQVLLDHLYPYKLLSHPPYQHLQFRRMSLPSWGRMPRHLDKVKAALHTLVQCEVKSALAPLG